MQNINQKRLVATFCGLVKIKSPSGHEEIFASFLVNQLKKLGLKTAKDKYGNVIAKLKGAGKPLVLCCHMDTVAVGPGKEINPKISKRIIRSDGTTILGADNKDSIAAILEMLTVLREKSLTHRALELVFTREEEAISKGARNLDFSLLAGRDCVISDHCEKYGAIVQGAPYNFQFQATIKGRRVHVKAPEKGVNAIAIAAAAIGQMPLGRVDRFTTANVAYQIGGLQGTVDSETKKVGELALEIRNSVPDLAIAYGEARGVKREKVEITLQKIKHIFEKTASKHGGRATFNSRLLAEGYFLKKNDALIQKIQQIFRAQGVKPFLVQAIGGSDANIFNNRARRAVVIS
ncbi:MAG: M20/M25/M40 family metallo-hydrolase, partial [Candidatus Magasanikbacteria bacterium]|nr:M20/M25/M40 family metallo-hydrolase [Candidatus Magasanikbacteria bacterium]